MGTENKTYKTTPKSDTQHVVAKFNFKKEIVIVVGTEQHDFDYGSALQFPAQAVREVRENYSNSENISIIIFTDAYTPLSLDIIKRDAKSHNKNLHFKKINSTSELIKYLNDGDTTVKRSSIKIETIKIFSHGYPLSLEFGLDGKNEETQRFGISDIPKLKPSSFTKAPSIYSYACRTGNSDITDLEEGINSSSEYRKIVSIFTKPTDYYNEKTWKYKVRPQNSLAQKLANHLDAKVYAYITRSDYNPTWNDNGDTSGYKATRMTIENEDINGVKKIFSDTWQNGKHYTNASINKVANISGDSNLLDAQKSSRYGWDEMIWNTQGAYKIPKGGDSPFGLPRGLFLFQKDAEETKVGE